MLNFNSSKYPPHAIHNCNRKLYGYRQDRDTSVPDYNNFFCNNIDVVEKNCGDFVIVNDVMAQDMTRCTPPIEMVIETQ